MVMVRTSIAAAALVIMTSGLVSAQITPIDKGVPAGGDIPSINEWAPYYRTRTPEQVGRDVEIEQNAVLERRRAGRDNAAVERALAEIVTAAKGTANLIEPILAAARAEATLGEICGVLREEWGEYRETTGL